MPGIHFTVYKGGKDGIHAATTHKAALERDEVLIRITHSGVCGTDEHFKGADMALGHEGVGVVEKIGPAVTDIKVGDRVGWGYLYTTCGRCEKCLNGKDTYCTGGKREYSVSDHDQGSFGTYAVWPAQTLHVIPDGLASEDAAPLMCAGITVFSVLDQCDRSTQRVGIVGIGGLGHLAIQFAAKMGMEVVVFSSTETKREEALALGATEFYVTSDKSSLDIGRKLDHLLITANAQPNCKLFVPLLNPLATIYMLTVSFDDFAIPVMPMLLQGLRVQGSHTGSRATLRRMLKFSAFHGIKPIIQKYPMSKEGVDKALASLADGSVRYRAVLVA